MPKLRLKLLPKDRLSQIASASRRKPDLRSNNKRILILGVGNRMRGDDAIGCLIADELKKEENSLSVIDCGTTPENFIDKVCALAPTRIIIVDACDFKAKPGHFRIFTETEIEKIDHHLISTHTLPLSLAVALIKKQLVCQIQLLGVQPSNLNFSTDLSPQLKKAKDEIVKYLKDLMKNNERRKG